MTIHVTSRDGTSIGCQRYGAGPPLVLVHGTTADHTRWAPIASTLEQKFTVYACDRRGRGLSGDGPTYSLDREVDDVAAIADAIGEPFFLLGHSYGAIVALEAARRLPAARLVLYEPPIVTSEPFTRPDLIDRLEQIEDREQLLVEFLREGPRIPADQIERMKSLPAWQGRVAAARTISRECRAATAYRWEPGGPPAMPVLLLLGGVSPAPFRAAVERLHAELPNSRVVVMPDQHHNAIDMAPALFLREVLAFLD